MDIQQIRELLFKDNVDESKPIWADIPQKDLSENEKSAMEDSHILPIVRYFYNKDSEDKDVVHRWVLWMHVKDVSIMRDAETVPLQELWLRVVIVPDGPEKEILDHMDTKDILLVVNKTNDIIPGVLCIFNDKYLLEFKTILPVGEETASSYIRDYMEYVTSVGIVFSFSVFRATLEQMTATKNHVAVVSLKDLDTDYLSQAMDTTPPPYMEWWDASMDDICSKYTSVVLDIAQWQTRSAVFQHQLEHLRALQSKGDCTIVFFDSTVEMPSDMGKLYDNQLYRELFRTLTQNYADADEATMRARIVDYQRVVLQIAKDVYCKISEKDTESDIVDSDKA